MRGLGEATEGWVENSKLPRCSLGVWMPPYLDHLLPFVEKFADVSSSEGIVPITGSASGLSEACGWVS